MRFLGKKRDANRPVMINFVNLKDKEKFLYKTADLPPGIKLED